MTEHLEMKKPSRSDEVLHADQQLTIANQIRAHFDSIAPKRPIKPNRSDIDSSTKTTSLPQIDEEFIPEFLKLQSLRFQSNWDCFKEGDYSLVQEDEFVETHYYKQLISIDKQHHTTGNGFIKVDVEKSGESGDGFEIGLQSDNNGGARELMNFISNPARNDWIPSLGVEEEVINLSII